MADLIHCITNPISMNLCANAVLSLGAKPIMAEHPREVKEITAGAQALLLNLGNISDTRMEAMRISFAEALEKEIPVVIDAVGVACSKLRREFFFELLSEKNKSDKSCIAANKELPGKEEVPAHETLDRKVLLIKGNYSEIKALADCTYKSRGVDAEGGDTADEMADIAQNLSKKLTAFILATGKRDIITDGNMVFLNDSGHQMMSMVTGTGCMLGAICATFLAREASVNSVVKACTLFGIAGEKAAGGLEAEDEKSAGGLGSENERVIGRYGSEGERVGTGSFQVALLDELYFSYEEDQEKDRTVQCPCGQMQVAKA